MKKMLKIILIVLIMNNFLFTAYATELENTNIEIDSAITNDIEQDDTVINENEDNYDDFLDEQDDILAEQDNLETEPIEVRVTDIVVSDFNNEMNVDETQNISATVLPNLATNTALSYYSSNSSIATVNSIGAVKAIGKGNCTITVMADGFETQLSLTVKVKTEKIDIEKTFITLKANQTYAIGAKITPSIAPQALNYKSSNEEIIVVDADGIITAKSIGDATIIISNDDMIVSMNVIVNNYVYEDNNSNFINDTDNNIYDQEDVLVQKIKNSNENVISVSNLEYVSSDVLTQLYGTKKSLKVECDGYNIILNGKDILNINNTLITEITMTEENSGLRILINEGKSLPGKITIELTEETRGFKYIYIYSNNKNKYEKLNSLVLNNTFEIDYSSVYLLATKKTPQFKINIIIVSMVSIALIILIGIYIFIKKKYWFW